MLLDPRLLVEFAIRCQCLYGRPHQVGCDTRQLGTLLLAGIDPNGVLNTADDTKVWQAESVAREVKVIGIIALGVPFLHLF